MNRDGTKRRQKGKEGARVSTGQTTATAAATPPGCLLSRLHRGDETAFEALFVRHYPQVYRVVYNLVQQPHEAEDLVQETFLAFYRSPPHLAGGDDDVAAWLCRVALNRGYNALRRERRAHQRIEQVGHAAAASGTDTGDPQATALRRETRAQVRAVLARLPERQSKLLLLRYAGLSYADIAATLRIAPGSVGTLLARAERAFLAASAPLLQEIAPEQEVRSL